MFCFLKGLRALSRIRKLKAGFEQGLSGRIHEECPKLLMPNSLEWWARHEEKHGRGVRKARADGGDSHSFGMFGLRDMGYRAIKGDADRKKNEKSRPLIELAEDPTLNCECTG